MASPDTARVRAIALTLAATLVATSACKPPRSPRKQVAESISGEWTAVSRAPGDPADTGRVSWRLALEQRPAGNLAGEGAMTRGSTSSPFAVSGVRDESQITLYFDLPGERVKYHGGIPDIKTITGELFLPSDTIPVTFTRE